MTARTIARTRELDFEANANQKTNWGRGWKSYLFPKQGEPPDPEEANRVLAMIVSAAAGALSQSGAGFFLSVVDAERRVRGVNVPNSRQLKKLKGRRGKEYFDNGGVGDEVRPEARQEPPGRPQQQQKAPPKAKVRQAPPKKEPEAPATTPTLSRAQSDRLSDMMRGKDGENVLSRLATDHLEGRTDSEGEPVTLERIAEKAREKIAPDLPVESFMGTVGRALVSMRAVREFRREKEQHERRA